MLWTGGALLVAVVGAWLAWDGMRSSHVVPAPAVRPVWPERIAAAFAASKVEVRSGVDEALNEAWDGPRSALDRAAQHRAIRADELLGSGDAAGAIPLLTWVLTQHENLYGTWDPATVSDATGLARACLAAGEPAAAISLLTFVTRDPPASLGEGHIEILRSMGVLGEAFARAARPEDAEATLLDAHRGLHPLGDPDARRVASVLSGVYQTLGEGDLAEVWGKRSAGKNP